MARHLIQGMRTLTRLLSRGVREGAEGKGGGRLQFLSVANRLYFGF